MWNTLIWLKAKCFVGFSFGFGFLFLRLPSLSFNLQLLQHTHTHTHIRQISVFVFFFIPHPPVIAITSIPLTVYSVSSNFKLTMNKVLAYCTAYYTSIKRETVFFSPQRIKIQLMRIWAKNTCMSTPDIQHHSCLVCYFRFFLSVRFFAFFQRKLIEWQFA